MLVTVDNLNLDFLSDIDELNKLIEEYKKLEKAIEESPYYKLLAGKTQVLGKDKGTSKKERSRLAHTKMVAFIAGEIVGKVYDSVLEANPSFREPGKLQTIFELNRELAVIKARCIGKAHDIGHEPFGHAGEKAKNDFYSSLTPNEIGIILNKHRANFGEKYEKEQGHDHSISHYAHRGNTISFEHNESSALLFNEIVKDNNIKLPDSEIKDCTLGILAHSTSRVSNFELIEGNLAAQAVRVSDKIEYRNADFDELRELLLEPKHESITAGFLRMSFKDRIRLIIDRIVEEAKYNGRIWEEKSDRNDRTPVMEDLGKFRKWYESSIFLFDSSYSEFLLREKLFPIIHDEEQLQEFYKNNPGVEVWYPKWKLLRIYENKTYLEDKAKNGEIPNADDEEMSNWNSDKMVSFRGVLKGENSERIHFIYKKVLQYYHDNPDKIPDEFEVKVTPIDYESEKNIKYKMNPNYSQIERAINYISLFDDASLMEKYLELVEERIQKGALYGIEPVTVNEMEEFIKDTYRAEIGKFTVQRKLTGRSIAEIEAKYNAMSKEFYSTGLTEKGKKAYHRFYKQRFSEYEIDRKLYERMIEADKKRGTVDYDGWFFYYGDDYDKYNNSIIDDVIEIRNNGTNPSCSIEGDEETYSDILEFEEWFNEENYNPKKISALVTLMAIQGLYKNRRIKRKSNNYPDYHKHEGHGE